MGIYKMLSYSTIKDIYNKFGYSQFWREDINEMNLIGIRGYSDAENTPNQYNDIIAVAYVNSSNEQTVDEFLASVDPGWIKPEKVMNKDGLAYLQDGVLYWYHLDTRFATYFSGGKYVKMNYPCMRHYGASVPVWRDSNFNGSLEEMEYNIYNTGSGILIHYGGEDMRTVGAWSQGCQVIPGIQNYERFIQLMELNKNTINGKYDKEIGYLLVDSRKLSDYMGVDDGASLGKQIADTLSGLFK
jgi:hypothetical protein